MRTAGLMSLEERKGEKISKIKEKKPWHIFNCETLNN